MDTLKNKIKMHLLPLVGLSAITEVFEFGTIKYAENDWRGDNPTSNAANDHKGAILRHLTRMEMGEIVDEESGLRHEYHIAARALMWVAHIRVGTNVDNQFRYKDKTND